MQRRSFLAAALAASAAPAIVRADSLMRIFVPKPTWHTGGVLRNESFDLSIYGDDCELIIPNGMIVAYSSARVALLGEREVFLRERAVHKAKIQQRFDEWLTLLRS